LLTEKKIYKILLARRTHALSMTALRGLRLVVCAPRKALRGGIQKVNLEEILPIFCDKYPQNGSKNDTMAARKTLECPHEGPRGVMACGLGLGV